MPGYRGLTGSIVPLQHHSDDGCVVQTWTVEAATAAEVARLLGEPEIQQIYTTEQLDAGAEAMGAIPELWRG